MSFEPALTEGRRARSPQAPLAREVARSRLVVALEGRFAHPLTVVVAGAGFGKTTALAQGVRANLAAPRGVDAWVSCEAGDGDDRRLARAIVGSLGVDAAVGDPLGSVLGAIGRHAPVDVCVLLDDLHELPTGSAGERLVGRLLDVLPAHAHLVLASRTPVPLPLARRRAAGEVVDLDAHDLAFRSDEIAALARLHDRPVDPQGLPDLGGWPSLVALTLSARHSTAGDYLWEEIVAELPPADRRALLAMVTLGWGTAEDVVTVAGAPVAPGRVAELVRTVPLLAGGGRDFSAHQLWEDVAPRIFEPGELAEVRGRTLALFARRDQALRLGAAATRWDDIDGLRAAALSLVRSSLGALPIDTARRWLAIAGDRARDHPELRLLGLALRQSEQVAQADIDEEVDELIERFGSAGDAEIGRAESLAVAAVAAHGRADLVRLAELAERARALPRAADVPLLRFLCGAIDASLASLAGDAERSLQVIATLPFDRVPASVSELVVRLQVTMSMLTGRIDEAVTVSARLAASADPHVRRTPAFVRWAAGDPVVLAARPMSLDDALAVNDRDRYMRAADVAAVAASHGDRPAAAAAVEQVQAYDGRRSDARNSAITALALAAVAVLHHDEPGARAELEDHLGRFPWTDPLSELHLRRRLAVAYALVPELASHWDAAPLGPSLARVREVGGCFVAARRGALGVRALPEPGLVVAALPLPWSVELAVTACRQGIEGGDDLLAALAEWSLAPTRDELARLVASGRQDLAREAADLLAELPLAAGPSLQIDVLGPLRVTVGGRTVDRPELRRGRVRTLVELLAVRGPQRRDQLVELLWPGTDVDRARQNLRTTLTRLRHLLEPERSGATYGTRLRAHGETVSLAGPPGVDVDLWQFRRLVARSDELAAVSGAEALDALAEAVGLWRGAPVEDLEAVAGLEHDAEHLRAQLVDACLRLGEQLLAAGQFDRTLECVERCRTAAPYSERAHRLAIAALLQQLDRDGLAARVARLRAMLEELDVDPEPATAMLLARADEALGDREAVAP